MKSVLVLEAEELIASLWISALSAEPGLSVVGSAVSVEQAIAKVHTCDVVLMGTNVPENEALRFIRAVTVAHPSVRIVAAGVPRSEASILRYVEAGVHSFVLKEDSVQEVVDCIHAVTRGEARVAPDIAPLLMTRLMQLKSLLAEPETRGGRYGELTARERQVLELIAQGLTNQEIARRLVIEVGTVKNHVHSILHKLELSSRYEAAAYLRALAGFRAFAAQPELQM